MAETALFTFDPETLRRLRDLAEDGKRSELIRNLINHEWEIRFNDGTIQPMHVTSVDELPRPADGESVPVVMINPHVAPED